MTIQNRMRHHPIPSDFTSGESQLCSYHLRNAYYVSGGGMKVTSEVDKWRRFCLNCHRMCVMWWWGVTMYLPYVNTLHGVMFEHHSNKLLPPVIKLFHLFLV